MAERCYGCAECNPGTCAKRATTAAEIVASGWPFLRTESERKEHAARLREGKVGSLSLCDPADAAGALTLADAKGD